VYTIVVGKNTQAITMKKVIVMSENNNTFVIRLLNTQNQTWQGTVTWLGAKSTQPFRSLLELIMLIDSAIEGDMPEEEECPT